MMPHSLYFDAFVFRYLLPPLILLLIRHFLLTHFRRWFSPIAPLFHTVLPPPLSIIFAMPFAIIDTLFLFDSLFSRRCHSPLSIRRLAFDVRHYCFAGAAEDFRCHADACH